MKGCWISDHNPVPHEVYALRALHRFCSDTVLPSAFCKADAGLCAGIDPQVEDVRAGIVAMRIKV